MMRARLVAVALAAALWTSPLLAADAVHAPEQKWSFDGPFGTFDKKAAKRGLQVYQEVCAACHSMNLVAFRHLSGLGMSEGEIKALAAKSEVLAGPDDEGAILNDDNELRRRPGRLTDAFPAPYLNVQAAASANSGSIPPDLSVISKAREGGANYIFALMALGYKEEPPAGVTLVPGKAYNTYFPGNQIAMPPPISDDQVEYADGTKATVAQMSRDVAVFLAWTSEPELEERKRTGIKWMIFLIVFTAMLYALKQRIWAKLH
jgi:ubiquinol-cytochrome c reductase cytochrome c1 subunit